MNRVLDGLAVFVVVALLIGVLTIIYLYKVALVIALMTSAVVITVWAIDRVLDVLGV